MKRSNLSEHYSAKHGSYDQKFPAHTPARKSKVAALKSATQAALQSFTKAVRNEQGDKNVLASLKVSWLLARNKKPFSDMEIIKECAVEIVQAVADEKELKMADKIRALPLSAETATRRVTMCVTDINQQLTELLRKSVAISLAVDESTDISDMAQCCIFLRLITDSGEILEDILDICPLSGRTCGIDIFQCVLHACEKLQVPLDRVYSLCTDGAPSMKGSDRGFVALFRADNRTRDDIIAYHCLLHQENLASMRSLNSVVLKEVMDDVISIVNYIRGKPLCHRQFRSLLEEYDAEYGELVYHSQVRWLSKGEVLKRFHHLFVPIQEFLAQQQNLTTRMQSCVDSMKNKEWLEKLCFLVDITSHLNTLCRQNQGKDRFITDLYSSITAFKAKLQLFQSHLSTKNTTHFPHLNGLYSQNYTPRLLKSFAACLRDMLQEFQERFVEFEGKRTLFTLVSNPWLITTEELEACKPFISQDNLPSAQLELLDLQTNDVLRRLHAQADSQQTFWKTVHEPILRNMAFKILSMFGSTYRCEQTFSTMGVIKNKLRNRLSNEHTTELVKAAVTTLKPNFAHIVTMIQAQKSH